MEPFRRERLLRDYRKFEAVTEENMNPPHPRAMKPARFPQELLRPVRIPERKFRRETFLCVTYRKTGNFIYVSHLETMEALRKACRRSSLPMTFSKGFNKHEKLHSASPLPLYFHSECEKLYVELYERADPAEMLRRLRSALPGGLEPVSLALEPSLPDMSPSARLPDEYRLDFMNRKVFERVCALLDDLPEELEFEKKSAKKRKARSGSKKVRKRVAGALSGLRVGEDSVFFAIEHPDTGAISTADFLKRCLDLPVESWNVDVRITRAPV